MRILAILAVLLATLAVPVATGAESPISPLPEQWELDLEQEKLGGRDVPGGLQPVPIPALEMCDVYMPGLGSVELPCKYVDDFLEYWQQLIWW